MYKNIIFDFGGVMVDFDPKSYLVDRFCNAETEELVNQLTFDSEGGKEKHIRYMVASRDFRTF